MDKQGLSELQVKMRNTVEILVANQEQQPLGLTEADIEPLSSQLVSQIVFWKDRRPGEPNARGLAPDS